MNNNITIMEDYTLPSLGKIYGKPFDPDIKLRSMTVAEEMKRLTNTDKPYKAMADIIESCMETKIPVSIYDLCIGDYQYLLHKLRTVTYGPNYNVSLRCGICGEITDTVINLDDITVKTYTEEYDKLKTQILPVSGDTVELRFQTPRDLDGVENRRISLKKQFPEMDYDPSLMLNLETVIKTINGQVYDQTSLREYIRRMEMRDSLLILEAGTKLNSQIGLETDIPVKCSACGSETVSPFRYTEEFFRPTFD